jgi:asparagine synthase (glutamine-hydrolysing)
MKTKHVLKKALSKRLPREILNRKKAGFPVPYATWLGTELRGAVAEILLDESALARGYFKKQTIENMIRAWPAQNYTKELFSLVTLELWHRAFLDMRRPQRVDEDLSCVCST